MILWLDAVLVIILILVFLWPRINLRRSGAKVLENRDFLEKSQNGQIIDIRESNEFRVKHILGARNLPSSQIAQSLSAIRKDKPVLIYGNGPARAQGSRPVKVALQLKKAGFSDVYLLKDGLNKWAGKVKEQ
ncbi:MAG: rhodanese-like domain-containing protein [Streptococcaceae bacterium]|jgi:rhodanese-related sulfurtransferase|nr:rhodanese-like domain-containing protein [Streptococcaceae bacterium]